MKRPWLLTMGVLALGVALVVLAFPTIKHVTQTVIRGGDAPPGKTKQPP